MLLSLSANADDLPKVLWPLADPVLWTVTKFELSFTGVWRRLTLKFRDRAWCQVTILEETQGQIVRPSLLHCPWGSSLFLSEALTGNILERTLCPAGAQIGSVVS